MKNEVIKQTIHNLQLADIMLKFDLKCASIRIKKAIKQLEKMIYYNYSERKLAYNTLKCAIERGEIIRPDNCSRCNIKSDIIGHHEDYSRPLEVIWLCYKCHRKIPPYNKLVY